MKERLLFHSKTILNRVQKYLFVPFTGSLARRQFLLSGKNAIEGIGAVAVRGNRT
uniref:Uncharacterized protein n=1 Tax=Candidatus Kentrum sp. FW TaxID=2126338 RepID=A0A450S9W7_9GAMM|nr:MAG: hypothetical protein BECKFW1821B_GA0114236_100188 [Candidatus Kentron sp. FW]VFJ48887.1 MAG: hypothetical protein BECKFW1821A_GA0114235_10214 [Candidatus Kentron sp. FW]